MSASRSSLSTPPPDQAPSLPSNAAATALRGDQAEPLLLAEGEMVPPALARRLAEIGDLEVALALTANPGARLSASDLLTLLRRFPREEALHAALIKRSELPPEAASALATLASDDNRRRLVARHPLPPGKYHEVMNRSRHRPSWWSHGLRAAG